MSENGISLVAHTVRPDAERSPRAEEDRAAQETHAADFPAIRLRLLEFAADHSLPELLQKSLDEAEAVSGSQIAFYHFVDADGVTLSLQAWSTRTAEHFCKAKGQGLHYPIDKAGVWVDCVHERRPVVHNDYATLPHKKGMPEGHAPVTRELVVPICRDGKVVAVLGVGNKAENYTDADVQAVAYLADVTWEITRRKRAETALRESEAELDTIFNSLSDAVVFTDPETGRICRVNETWIRQTGIARATAIGRTGPELGLWLDPQERSACLALFERDGRVTDFLATVRLQGEPRQVALTVAGIVFRGKRFILWELRDVTERERLLRESALLKYSIDVHHDAAYWLDSDNRFVYVNEVAEKSLGYAPGELVGKSLDTVDPHATPEGMQALWGKLREQRGQAFQATHRRKDGSEFPVEVRTNFVRFGGKEYACGFARDISEQKQAEAEKTRLQEQLVHAQKMESVGRLAGGVAHDFNNMLGVILAHAEMALEEAAPESEFHKHLRSIQAAAQRSAGLTRQLLAFARRQTVAPAVVDLNAVVSGMLSMVQRLIGEDIRLMWRPGTALWPVLVDATQIDQILANLCVNARDAITDVGTIWIETGTKVVSEALEALASPGDYVWLSVRDTGTGMDAATKSRAFEPFFTTKAQGKGTGLGLATVYGIVRQNGGFIELDSEVGKGTTITIYLPRQDKVVREPVAPVLQPRRGGETILLVEDERNLAAVVTTMLERAGYEVLTAVTPGEAIRFARERSGAIDLLITDVVMPEMNGRDLAQNILSLHPRAKRLFMSGYTADVIAQQGILAEGVFYIQKPFTARDLTSKVRDVLART